ncbi:PKD domain-containing protein [Neolewinella aurantiaca]|uniref:PKD domain-containing protein n=1 Tax=Neolewinella aurantiaca TaxID=2602767 RepID=A0A5C7FGQ3_9BACT|nr:PKD domain-containing protein [Neolewinella aurantiaca]TXF85454.1 PKD domain-containing protein [Neolewinella aurantiaca]
MQHFNRITTLTLLLLSLLCTSASAQDTQDFPPDILCVPFVGGGFIGNVIEDDIPAGVEYFVRGNINSECFMVDERGNFSFTSFATEEFCCGPQDTIYLEVFVTGPDGTAQFIGVQAVHLTIKCAKPDCGLVDLDALTAVDPTGEQQETECISACENSTATYLFAQNPDAAYDWTATNGTVDPSPGLPGQINVSWGALGFADLSVDIYDDNGNLIETRTWCVNLTPAPVADFTFLGVACLDQPVTFTNVVSGPSASYDWDFGDGSTAINTTNPTHVYETAGTYTVTLVATSDGGLNPDGSQACCCTDSISYEIEIDPLPGPPIYCLSTLCEGDTSKYWSDFTNCAENTWSFTGDFEIVGDFEDVDTVCVIWHSGPSGTVSLQALGCDVDYCPVPTTIVVPIISSEEDISGPTEVCRNETANYELPKWMTTLYNWSVSGGTINGSITGHTASITWPSEPGEYTITVEYESDFLAGLPGHSGSDCTGKAELTVTVLGDFTVSASPNPACVNGSTFFSGTSNIDVGATFNWSIVGHPGFESTGQPTYTVEWADLPGPGNYTISVDVVNPEDYCVSSRTITVSVREAVDPTISGPTTYCIGDPVVYSVASPTPGYYYFWSVSAGTGSVTLGQGGPNATLEITSDNAVVSVVGYDQSAPFCLSNPATHMVSALGFNSPAVITGPGACTNSEADYSIDVPQPAGTSYAWSVSPEIAGSVVAGADGPMATIQWNNAPGTAATIELVLSLCGQDTTLEFDLTLTEPAEPVITQSGSLCPGGSTDLTVSGGTFDDIRWAAGQAPTGSIGTTATITVTEPGSYVVFTTDENGCTGVARYRVEEVDGPDVQISTPHSRRICVNSPPYPVDPVLTASTDAANTIEWFCGGDSQGPAATGNTTFMHVWTDEVKTFTYRAQVVDPNGCVELSDPIFIRQELCCGPPYRLDSLTMIHTFTATNRTPDCDIIDLVATFGTDSIAASNFSWDFLGATTVAFGGDPLVANDSLSIRLPGVGTYDLFHTISNWAYDYDTTYTLDPATGQQVIDEIFKADSILCGETLNLKVVNPIFADFDKREECGTVVFENLSDFIGGTPPPTVTYDWDFGDGSGTSTLSDPSYTYSDNGVYTVTLTVMDGGCRSIATMTVEVTDLPDSAFTVDPNPVCYGQPAMFIGTGTNVISWHWDFGDGASFVGNTPQHTFLPTGGSDSSTVTLVTENSAGCLDTFSQVITVFPVPATDNISASNGLIICDGEETTLSVDLVPGLSYLWSTGATGNSIVVDAAGTYGVTLTTSDGCQTIVDPVEVQLIPLPDASWLGNPYICDNGSTTLTALAGGGHTYLWTNQETGATGTSSDFTVNFHPSFPVQTILLQVTSNGYNCTSESLITVTQAVSPAPDAQITAGDACEGTGSLLEVVNFDPDLNYTWNTGAAGPSIFVFAAGTYTVVATDPISGCTGTDQVTINPLPDLCIVPTGCYEACIPDTIPGPVPPAGTTYSYQWTKDGAPFSNDPFIIATMSGTYTLTVYNNTTGCFDTSDELMLELIDCSDPEPTDCDDIVTSLKSAPASEEGDGCCFELFYTNMVTDAYAVQISSPDADLTYITGLVNPALGYHDYLYPSVVQLAVDEDLLAPLPTDMNGPPAVTICPDNFTSVPQTIVIEYLNADLEVVCVDTLYTDCQPEPDCAYISQDTLYCNDEGGLTLEVEVCNPADALFSISYIDFRPNNAIADVDFDLGLSVFPAIAAGDCRVFTISLSDLPAGASFEYFITAHAEDPTVNPGTLCCTDDRANSIRKLLVPDCDPCDNLWVREVFSSEEDCCHEIVLYNDAVGFDFDEIDLCLIGAGSAELAVYNALGADLDGYTTANGVTVHTASGDLLPLGNLFLPTVCIDGGDSPEYQIEIKWINDKEVVCRDTVTVFCKPDCGYLSDISIECEDGAFVYTGTVYNTSDVTMSEAYIQFADSLGLASYNTSIVFGSPLPPGGSTTIQFPIGGPAGPGDVICFTVVLHEIGSGDNHDNCCDFEHCIILPDCRIEACNCENKDELEIMVNQSFDIVELPSGPYDYRLIPRADFSSCDSISWVFRRLSPTGPPIVIGSNPVEDWTFPGPGRYRLIMRVTRIGDDGETCEFVVQQTLVIPSEDPISNEGGPIFAEVSMFPNPAQRDVTLIVPAKLIQGDKVNAGLYDFQGRVARAFSWDNFTPDAEQRFQLDLKGLPAGIYLVRGDGWAEKLIIRN